MEALAKYPIPKRPMRCLLVILRETYGWSKKESKIELSEFVEKTGLKKTHICNSLKWLQDKNIITKNGNFNPPSYSFQKHYTKWEPLPETVILPKTVTNVTGNGNLRGSPPISIKTRKDNVEHAKIVGYLNEKANTNFKHISKVTRRHIKARWNEGFRLIDFQKVIDVKCDQWKTDAKMVAYLRPQTLFGTKFESYLNEHSSNKHYEQPLSEEEKWMKSQGKL
jgi:phage replication O-like protein O